jgi:ubiquinone/menaquinone biosynthesis C-methylase UbiE
MIPIASIGVGDSRGRRRPLAVKVVSVPDLTKDVHWTGIKRGMYVLDLGCGVGDVSLWIANLVGPGGLVVGVDESSKAIDVAQKRATVAGQCYWVRFVAADLGIFSSHERFDVVVVRRVLSAGSDRATLLRLSSWVRDDGVIMIIAGESARITDSRHRNGSNT